MRIIMTMLRFLRNWKHNLGPSCTLSVLLTVILSLVLVSETYSKPQNQYQNQHSHQETNQIMPMPNVIRRLRNWDHSLLKDHHSSSASGSNGYFLLQKFARPSQALKLGFNEYDGLANLDWQEQPKTSADLRRSSASVDVHVSDGSLQRLLSPSRQFRDIPQIRLNCLNAHDNGCDGQGRLVSGIETDHQIEYNNFYGGTKTKRSIGFDTGLGPIRVFKYISEDQILQSLSTDNSDGVNDKTLYNRKKTDVNNGNEKKFKSAENSTLNHKTKSKSKYQPDLKLSTVTDRSLIPNSYFSAEPQNQKHNQTDNQPQEESQSVIPIISGFNSTNTSTYSFSESTTIPPSLSNIRENNSDINSSKMPSARAYKGIRRKIRNKISNRRRISNAEFLLFNASLSERSRRSPYRYPYMQPIMFQQQQRLMQQKQQQLTRQQQHNMQHKLQQQQQNMQQQLQQQRLSQIQQPTNNRAAVYTRNGIYLPPLNTVQQPQAFQTSRFASVPNRPNAQSQYPSLQLTVPPPPKAVNNDIAPSSSNDYFNYRPNPQTLPYNPNYNSMDPNIVQEPSWNHPMYRQYSKVAKRVQNKVSGVMGHFGKGSNSRRDFPKKPIPLPRPKPSNNKARRIRSRNRGGDNNNSNNNNPNGNIRYSYPKSAQNIQDILNHFQHNNNDILDSVPKSSKNRHSGDGYGHGGPSIPSDLSSELNDVKFSLLRDIREFSKRPSNNDMPRDDDHRNNDDSSRYRDEPSPKRAPFYSDDHKKNSYRFAETKKYHHDEDSPTRSSYQNDDGYDEMSSPKPKLVRDMVKKTSSKFRDESDRETSSSREKESQHSKKRDRLPHYQDREDDIDNKDKRNHKDFDSEDRPSPYGKHGTKYFDDDSTERSPIREDRYKNDRPIRHPSSGERHRSRLGSKEDRGRDRDQSYSKEQPKRTRTKFSNRDSDDFNSFETRNSNSNSNSKHHHRPTERETINRNRELMNYPTSIRDKIRESSREFDRHGNKISREPSSQYRGTNKPIVIKRPYEPYRVPPTMLIPNFEIPKKSSEQDFWSNYASATEKNLYGYNPHAGPARPPLLISSPAGGYTPRYGGSTVYNVHPTPSISPDDEDVLEIHTGLPPPNNLRPDNVQEKSLQKAYLELLQHKMQAESALLNNQHVLSASSGHPRSPTKPKKTPMRMKIHIYPNTEAGPSETEMTNQNNFNTFGNQMNYGGSGYSESHPSNTLSIAPPRDSQKIGGSMRSSYMNQHPRQHSGHPGPGPVPPTQIGYGSGSNGNGKPSLSSSDKNKNLVLHLHVHRRNDGPVELDAEASELQTSTTKPSTYKDIFDGHHQQDQQSATVGDAEPDKSVSMEVPIHDDKIEDVLHTLLQFRDRGGSRKKRNPGTDEVT